MPCLVVQSLSECANWDLGKNGGKNLFWVDIEQTKIRAYPDTLVEPVGHLALKELVFKQPPELAVVLDSAQARWNSDFANFEVRALQFLEWGADWAKAQVVQFVLGACCLIEKILGHPNRFRDSNGLAACMGTHARSPCGLL